MPNVKTVKPDGTGDFTTLAAWHTYAAAQATADQWAECYGGGNLGGCVVAGWVSTPTAALYPRIYAHSTARHDGQLATFPPTTAAYVFLSAIPTRVGWSIPFVEIDGLVIYKNISGNAVSASPGGSPFTVRNCIVARTSGTVGGSIIDQNTAASSTSVVKIYNNIVYAAPGATFGGVPAIVVNDNGGLLGFQLVNNTIITNGKNSAGVQISSVVTGVVSNNVVTGIDTPGGQISLYDTEVIDNLSASGAGYVNNATEDGASTTYGDANEQLITASPFVSATNPTPVTGSLLINRGANTSVYGVTVDALGTARPQNVLYDIGAIELIISAAGGGYARIIGGRVWW